MSNKTRKHIWPGALVLSLAIVGVLAAFIVLAGNPASTAAHSGGAAGSHCTGESEAFQRSHDALSPAAHPKCADDMDPSPTTPSTGTGGTPMMADAEITLDGKTDLRSPSGASDIRLTIKDLPRNLPVGSSIVIYLEDDFQEPDSIPMSSVFLRSSDPPRKTTGNAGRVYVTSPVKIKTSDYFDKDKSDISIRVLVPDMCPDSSTGCEGQDGLMRGDMLEVVIESDSGIKNPSEAGSHSTGYALLDPSETEIPGRTSSARIKLNDVKTVAKIALSDVDNKRGYEMTVTGSGFNDGTTGAAYVLAHARYEVAKWWETLDCAGMKAALGTDSDNACFHFDLDSANMSYMLNTSDTMRGGSAAFKALSAADKKKYADMVFTRHLCRTIIEDGTQAGGAIVGSDDKVAVTFEVTAPTFKPGNVNYICMVDGEGRMSNTDVEDFNLEPSIKVVPSSVSTGDTVNVFAQDYQNVGQSWTQLKIGGRTTAPNGAELATFVTDRESISSTGEGSVTFKVPGGLEGVLRIDARWGMPDGDPAKCDIDAPNPCISKNSKITIAGAELNASKTDVLPNETITITGNGFGVQTCIPFSSFTVDDVEVMVHNDSAADRCGTIKADGTTEKGVEVSNSGQFVATIILWPMDDEGTNPTLIPGTHELAVEDTHDFSASVDLTIAAPSITVMPEIAGPRDYITVTGENWPVDNLDNSLSEPITVVIEDFQNGRQYPVYADSVGRVSVEHRVHRNVPIPSTVQVKANYDEGKVVEIGSFAVPASTIEVTPGEGQPGDTISLTAGNLPVYSEVDYVEIGGTTYSDPGVNTDRDGNVTVENVLIPGLDPGTYSVVIGVGDSDNQTIAIGEVDVLAESAAAGTPAELPGAVEELGDSLVAIFYFDDVGKVWSFYDPRPEFAELNTLSELVNGEAYWILVSETMEDVVLNNKVRNLTCRGDDCWNLEVW